jgi:hypothetical protein
MDELATYGIAALLVLSVGIVIAAYGIFLVVLMLARAAFSGDLLLVSGILAGIIVAAGAYVAAGLWLRKARVI